MSEHQVDAGRRQVPDGYESGPEAPTRAAARATVATRLGEDLAQEGVVVPDGGAHVIRKILTTDALRVTSTWHGGDTGLGRRRPLLTALCDRREAAIFHRALAGRWCRR